MTRAEFKKLIPLFTQLPQGVLDQLDLSGFYPPTDEIITLQQELEEKLGHFVVSYKAEVFNLKIKAEEHLCALVKGAKLNQKQLEILKKYEKLAEPFKVTFVVYQKPLELMDIKNSALYKEYLKRGLL